MTPGGAVRVVEGHVNPDAPQDTKVFTTERFDGDVPALLVIGSGLTAEQMRKMLTFQHVLDIVAANDPGIDTDSEATT